MRLVCISDTHALHEELDVPHGDVLVHAGDFTMSGRESEIRAFDAWLGRLPHPRKIVVAGNHDWLFQREPANARSLITNAEYLEDSGATIDGVRFWGAPWQPWFFDWAFNLRRGPEIAARWALVPAETDVLITHGPPRGVLDVVDRGESVGCEDLLRELGRIRPRVHVFGHIHESYGRAEKDGRISVNASSCSLAYRPENPPIVVDL
jgi:predicted phosphodiesterase